MDTLSLKFKTSEQSNEIFSSKPAILNSLKEKVVKNWSKKHQNFLKLVYVSKLVYVLGKRKYWSLRKADMQAKFQISNYVPYKKLAQII